MDKKNKIPKHVAIIMDGNGRWAKARMLPKVAGHNAGMQSLKKIVRRAAEMGVKYLTVYAFSTENWKRTEEEIQGIFGLLIKYIDSEIKELKENGIKVHILGDLSKMPKEVVDKVNFSLEQTQENNAMQFNIALNYGSRFEIVRAINKITELMESGKIPKMEVTEELLSKYLYTGEENDNIPDPDLIIRTSGEERLSNFLLWQSAYSEFAFSKTLWPDFDAEEFEQIVQNYQGKERRFGGRV